MIRRSRSRRRAQAAPDVRPSRRIRLAVDDATSRAQPHGRPRSVCTRSRRVPECSPPHEPAVVHPPAAPAAESSSDLATLLSRGLRSIKPSFVRRWIASHACRFVRLRRVTVGHGSDCRRKPRVSRRPSRSRAVRLPSFCAGNNGAQSVDERELSSYLLHCCDGGRAVRGSVRELKRRLPVSWAAPLSLSSHDLPFPRNHGDHRGPPRRRRLPWGDLDVPSRDPHLGQHVAPLFSLFRAGLRPRARPSVSRRRSTGGAPVQHDLARRAVGPALGRRRSAPAGRAARPVARLAPPAHQDRVDALLNHDRARAGDLVDPAPVRHRRRNQGRALRAALVDRDLSRSGRPVQEVRRRGRPRSGTSQTPKARARSVRRDSPNPADTLYKNSYSPARADSGTSATSSWAPSPSSCSSSHGVSSFSPRNPSSMRTTRGFHSRSSWSSSVKAQTSSLAT